MLKQVEREMKRSRSEEMPSYVDNPVPRASACFDAGFDRVYPPCTPPGAHGVDVTSGPRRANRWLCTLPAPEGAPSIIHHLLPESRGHLFPLLAHILGSECPLAASLRGFVGLTPEDLGQCYFCSSLPLPPSGCDASGGSGGGSASSLAFVPASPRVLFLDVDSTLICGTCPPASEWTWTYPSVPTRVKAYYDSGYKIVLVTNQARIKGSYLASQSVSTKIKGVAAALGVPCQVFMSTQTADFFYKPRPGIFWLLASLCNGGVPIHTPSCLFVGDACGRRDDHSCCDLGFAFNIGAPCTTPEAFFGGSVEAQDVRPLLLIPRIGEWAPGDVAAAQEVLRVAGIRSPSSSSSSKEDKKAAFLFPHLNLPRPGSPTVLSVYQRQASGDWTAVPPPLPPLFQGLGGQQEVVLLCGPPGAGKSTLSRSPLPPNYTRVCQDDLGGRRPPFVTKCRKDYGQLGRSIVLDKTLLDPKIRTEALRGNNGGTGDDGVFPVHSVCCPPGGIRVLAALKDEGMVKRSLHLVKLRQCSPFVKLEARQSSLSLRVIQEYCEQYEPPAFPFRKEDPGISRVVTWQAVWGASGTRCPCGGGSGSSSSGAAATVATAAAATSASAAFPAHACSQETVLEGSQATVLDEDDAKVAEAERCAEAAVEKCAPAGGSQSSWPTCALCRLDLAVFFSVPP